MKANKKPSEQDKIPFYVKGDEIDGNESITPLFIILKFLSALIFQFTSHTYTNRFMIISFIRAPAPG